MDSSKRIKVCGQSYDLLFPTVGKFIDIKVLEVKLSQGLSSEMVSGTSGQFDAFMFITTYAHFAVLCPDLLKDLKVNSLLDLSVEDFKELTQCYLTEIQPWISGVKTEIKEGMEDENKG